MALVERNLKASTLVVCLTLVLVIAQGIIIERRTTKLNYRPIIGILTQEINHSLKQKYQEKQYDSYIAASYVKFVEGAGARPVPIWIGQDETYYEDILSKVNGVLWPGGSSLFNESRHYADAGYTIYKIAKRLNNRGDYFPILGTCLGFELLTYVAAKRVEHRIQCSCSGVALPLEFKEDYQNSKMFRSASSDLITVLRERHVTANFHHLCVTEERLAAVNLLSEFHVLSLNHDANQKEFVSSIEHKVYPFYGLQFHPEKNLYEWGTNIPHGPHSTLVAQYFANFFINEARKSRHRFPSSEEESSSLIYNYPVEYTGLKMTTFIQCYMFSNVHNNSCCYPS